MITVAHLQLNPRPLAPRHGRQTRTVNPSFCGVVWIVRRHLVAEPGLVKGLQREPVGGQRAFQVVDTVQWYEVADQGRSTWFAVDRPVYVALTLPQGSGPTPIQDISQVIAKTLGAKPIDPAPVG